MAYLTFDDGPSEETEKILNALQEKDVKATFFVLGTELEKRPDTYKRIVSEGHVLSLIHISAPQRQAPQTGIPAAPAP